MSDGIVAHIRDKREERRAKGQRTSEATQAIFEIPQYDWWDENPKGYKKEWLEIHDEKTHGVIPWNRCSHCGSKYLGWERYAFCGICTIAMMHGVIPEEVRKLYSQNLRIPDNQTEAEFVIELKKKEQAEKLRLANEEYKKKTQAEPVKSDFRVARDL